MGPGEHIREVKSREPCEGFSAFRGHGTYAHEAATLFFAKRAKHKFHANQKQSVVKDVKGRPFLTVYVVVEKFLYADKMF